jgi:putative TIM-barrel protein, nifR3 family
MAGITDHACRIIAKSFGCGLVFTEMISDMGLIYKQTRTQRIADTSEEQRPVAVQIFGSNPGNMAEAARIVQDMGADIIDINMGCPTPKIVKNGEGAALMLNIPLAREIIRSVVDVARVPVTVKTRKGWDEGDETCLELACVAEQEGAAALTVHPRSRMQFFSGHSDWAMIKAVKDLVRIPVIGNGDIHNGDDARRMLEETGCEAVMIGRAALGNPFVLKEIAEFLQTGLRLQPPTREERVEAAEKHLELAIKHKGEWVGVREMRKQLAWYFKGQSGAAQIRTQINQATSKEEILQIMHSR